MSDQDGSEKTLDPSPERRRKARAEGQFPRTHDASVVAATLGALLVLYHSGGEIFQALESVARRCFAQPAVLSGDLVPALASVAAEALAVVLPLALVAAGAGVAAGLCQAGFEPRMNLLLPKWERLDLASRLPRVFSARQGAAAALLSLARVSVVGFVSYEVLSDEYPSLLRLSGMELSQGVSELARVALRLSFWCTLALVLIAALDYADSWHRHERQLRMSRQELKDELIREQGDPRIRAHRRTKLRANVQRGPSGRVNDTRASKPRTFLSKR